MSSKCAVRLRLLLRAVDTTQIKYNGGVVGGSDRNTAITSKVNLRVAAKKEASDSVSAMALV